MSYDDTDLSELNLARAALGDTSNDPDDELLTDDHIELILGEYGYNAGVALLADELAARAAQEPSALQVPGLAVTWGNLLEVLLPLANRYRALAAAEADATNLVIPASASVAHRVSW